jgi:hypothetical protein
VECEAAVRLMLVTTSHRQLPARGWSQSASRLAGPRLFDSRRVEASRDGHSDPAHAHLPADIFRVLSSWGH